MEGLSASDLNSSVRSHVALVCQERPRKRLARDE